jgi:cob(I)alamin adenosyltransferase
VIFIKGLTHIYEGNGKGKTTASIGLIIRALGNNMKVYFTQYLKNDSSSELNFLKNIKSNLTFGYKEKITKFSFNMSEDDLNNTRDLINKQFKINTTEILKSNYDMVIFDELINAVSLNFLDKKTVIEFINSKPEKLEIIMTGRNAPIDLINISDYVSEIKEIKHPFKNGIKSRKGIEY